MMMVGNQSQRLCTPTELGSGLVAPSTTSTMAPMMLTTAKMLMPILAPRAFDSTPCCAPRTRKICRLMTNNSRIGMQWRSIFQSGKPALKFPPAHPHPAVNNMIAVIWSLEMKFCVFVFIIGFLPFFSFFSFVSIDDVLSLNSCVFSAFYNCCMSGWDSDNIVRRRGTSAAQSRK